MGLNSFNVAPDNQGGRPEGSKEDRGYSSRESDTGHAMTIEHGEEYLKGLLEKFVEGDRPTSEEMGKMSHYSHLLPRSLKVEFHQHGILDYPDALWTKPDTTTSPDTSGSDDDENKGGIFSIVDESS